MKKDFISSILYIILYIIMIIFVLIGILMWCGIIYVGIKECYDINPNSLWVTIPTVIILHIYGYITFKNSIIFTIIILAFASYPIITPNDVLIKEDIEYLYYKEYKWWGLDSCINKYHKPIYYDGKVINKEIRQYIRGVLGKGGHWVTETTITISFDNKTYKDNIENMGYWSNVSEYNKGDKVKVIETFYPRHNIKYWK